MGTAEGPQWALGGDTFVVGCALPASAVFPQFNETNLDAQDDRYASDLGIYEPQCGLDNLRIAYGHDEYLFQMLLANKTTIPPQGLAMVRFHSCYPWHTGGEYRQFMTPHDHEMLPWVLEFNKQDLYTKDDHAALSQADVEALWPYYEGLLAKYIPDPNMIW